MVPAAKSQLCLASLPQSAAYWGQEEFRMQRSFKVKPYMDFDPSWSQFSGWRSPALIFCLDC